MSKKNKKVAKASLFAMMTEMWADVRSGKVDAMSINLTKYAEKYHVGKFKRCHTFATLQIALGTDIYTVSKMLTHKSVSTTQIYADLVNSKKRESANRISLK